MRTLSAVSAKPGPQQANEQRSLAQRLDRLEQVAHLEELDRVGAAELLQHLEPAHVAAELPHDALRSGHREAGLLEAAVLEDAVDDGHLQGRVERLDVHRLDRDQVGEMALQSALDQELRGRRDHRAVRLEDELQQARRRSRAA
jgi:hypothetical protein